MVDLKYSKSKVEEMIRYNTLDRTSLDLFTVTLECLGLVSNTNYEEVIKYLRIAISLLQEIIKEKIMKKDGVVSWYAERGVRSVRDVKFLMALSKETLTKELIYKYTSLIHLKLVGEMMNSSEVGGHGLENYFYICKIKTASYYFYLPIMMAYASVNVPLPPYIAEFADLCGVSYQMKEDLLTPVRNKDKTIFSAILGVDTSTLANKHKKIRKLVGRLINEYVNKLDGIAGVEEFGALEYCKDICNINKLN